MFGKRERPIEKFLSIPDFNSLTNQGVSTLVESNEVTVTADNAWVFTALVRGGDAEFNVNGTGWVKDAVFRNGDTIKLRATTSANTLTETVINLYAQSENKQWSITTEGITTPEGDYDSDAQAYITAVETADGQALETAVKDAINAFVVGCKADGIWNAIKASCILAGARTLDGALVPLVGTAPTNYNFVSGDYDRKTGLLGDGATKRLSTGFASNSVPDVDVHISTYLTSTPSSASEGYMGTISTGTETGLLLINTTYYPRLRLQGAGATVPARTAGFVGASRLNSNQLAYHYPGVADIQNITLGPATSDDIAVFARGNTTFSQSRQAFYSFGLSLDLALLDNRVSTLITEIGAAIP